MGSGTKQRTVGVVGDTHADATLMGRTEMFVEHFHGIDAVTPSMGLGVLLASSALAWTLGDFAVLVATNAIAGDFDFHWLNIEDASANGVYELVFYAGADASEVEIGRKRFVRETNKAARAGLQIMTPLLDANTQVKVKLASSNAVADTARISVDYHTYD